MSALMEHLQTQFPAPRQVQAAATMTGVMGGAEELQAASPMQIAEYGSHCRTQPEAVVFGQRVG
jgi:hypothetical protein